MLVTLAGHDIFKGRALLTASTPDDYSNFIVAGPSHDIGYVRGILKGDRPDGFVVDASGNKVTLPRGCSDAALAPHHVERSKLFVLDRLASIEELDGARIAGATGHVFPLFHRARRSPCPRGRGAFAGRRPDRPAWRSALFEKANALYHEFEEIGLNRQLGYELARRPGRQIPAILLGTSVTLHPGRDTLLECDCKRAPVDQRPLQQRLSRRARAAASVRPTTMIKAAGPSPTTPWRVYKRP